MFVANSIKDGANISAVRKKFEDAKLRHPRELQLKCLKNRQGNNYDCYFNYYSAHDYFTPATLTEFEANHPPEETGTAKAGKGKGKDKRNDNEVCKPVTDEEKRRLEDFWNSLNV